MLEKDAYQYVRLVFAERRECAVDGEPSTYIHDFDGRLIAADPNGKDVVVGTFRTIYIDTSGAARDRISLRDVFDERQSIWDIYEALFEYEELKERVCVLLTGEAIMWSENLLIIDRLTIDPQYRGQRLGLAAMRALLICQSPAAGFVVIKPFPLQLEVQPRPDSPAAKERAALRLEAFESNPRKATARLFKLYATLGFKRVLRTPFMVRSVDDPMQPLDQLGEAYRPRRYKMDDDRAD